MTRGVRIRIVAFLVLSAVGIVYIAGTYLGLVDRVLGRGITVHATLPTSGGLFEGSEVTYRGVKVGKVSKMQADRGGRHPRPRPRGRHPAARRTRRCTCTTSRRSASSTSTSSRPTTRARTPSPAARCTATPTRSRSTRATCWSSSTSSSTRSTRTTSRPSSTSSAPCSTTPASRCSGCSTTAARSSARRPTTPTRRSALLDQGKRVLTTQQGESENIRSSRSRPALAHRRARRQRRATSRRSSTGTPGTAREVDALLQDLEPTLPVLLGSAVERQPGRGLAPRRRRAAAGDLPAHHLRGLHRHARRRLRPRQPPARQPTPPVHAGLQAAHRLAAAERPDRRADLPGRSAPPVRRTRCAAPTTRPGSSGNPSPGRLYRSSYDPATGLRRGCRRPTGQPGTVRRSGQPVDPGRMTRGNGSWWVR